MDTRAGGGRAMDWVQYTVAGVLSGAPCPMSIRDGIRAALRPALIIAGGAVASEKLHG